MAPALVTRRLDGWQLGVKGGPDDCVTGASRARPVSLSERTPPSAAQGLVQNSRIIESFSESFSRRKA